MPALTLFSPPAGGLKKIVLVLSVLFSSWWAVAIFRFCKAPWFTKSLLATSDLYGHCAYKIYACDLLKHPDFIKPKNDSQKADFLSYRRASTNYALTYQQHQAPRQPEKLSQVLTFCRNARLQNLWKSDSYRQQQICFSRWFLLSVDLKQIKKLWNFVTSSRV